MISLLLIMNLSFRGQLSRYPNTPAKQPASAAVFRAAMAVDRTLSMIFFRCS